MMLCPEDRKAEGIIPVHSVRDNINISARRKHIHAGCLINNARRRTTPINISSR